MVHTVGAPTFSHPAIFRDPAIFKRPNQQIFYHINQKSLLTNLLDSKPQLFVLNISFTLRQQTHSSPLYFYLQCLAPINPNARTEVNDALISSGSAAVGQMVDTANSSIEKRRMNKAEREKRDAEEKAAKEKADAAVRPQPSKNLKPPDMLCADDINNRKAAAPARRLYTVARTTFLPIGRYYLHRFGCFTRRLGEACSAGKEGAGELW